MHQHKAIIVADIGASNARFGYVADISAPDILIEHIQKYRRTDYASFADVLAQYHADLPNKLKGQTYPLSVAIAGGRINSQSWQFAAEQWAFQTDDQIIATISDLEGFALGAISDKTHITLREDSAANDASFKSTIIAVGTGLGLSYYQDGQTFKTHGGHMHAAGISDEQNMILRLIHRLSSKKRMVIFEDVASGSGLVKLYQAVCIYNGIPVLYTTPEEIINLATPQVLEQTLRLFHEFLGLFAHMSLVFGHGYKALYLGGGVIDVLNDRGLFDQACFFKHLNQNAARIVAQNIESCPVYLLSDSNIALYGAAKAVIDAQERINA